jgi:microcystin degradation protein MlrC
VSAAAFDELCRALVDGIRACGAVDAVVLELHGAGVAEGAPDLDGAVAAVVRRTVGSGVPIVAPLDLHANITEEMAEHLDVMFGVHLYPHIDCAERGAEAVRAIPRLLSGEWTPVTHVERLPMLLADASTDNLPAREALDLCLAVERELDLIDCTLYHGFPFSDTEHTATSVVATANGDAAAAQAGARQVARWLWNNRERFRPTTMTAAEAVGVASAHEGMPVIINEASDNPGGGATGDATHLLRALVDSDVATWCFGYMYDPGAVSTAIAAGVGASVELDVGGRLSSLSGSPVTLAGRVRAITDGRVRIRSPMFRGLQLNLGPMVRIGDQGRDLIIGSARSQTFDPELFLVNGIDVSRYQIVALKSTNHFRAGFAGLADRIVTADGPGLTSSRVEVFPRRHAPGPLWPIDETARYES